MHLCKENTVAGGRHCWAVRCTYLKCQSVLDTYLLYTKTTNYIISTQIRMARTQMYTLYDNEEMMHSSEQFPESVLSTILKPITWYICTGEMYSVMDISRCHASDCSKTHFCLCCEIYTSSTVSTSQISSSHTNLHTLYEDCCVC